MIYEAEKNEVLKYRVDPPLFLPFYNQWGQNVYYKTEKFKYNPFKIYASSTSGSPVIVAGNKFFGFLSGEDGEFEFDGKCYLTIHINKGDKLYINESCDPYKEWKKYSEYFIDKSYKKCDFWSDLEYCTWVEQSKQAALSGIQNQDILCEKFVYDYLERVSKMGLPKGKFTIDDGWAVNSRHDGDYTVGDWTVDEKKFPNFERMIQDIKNEGYTPGLWFTPFTFTKNSSLAKDHPELIGQAYNKTENWYYILPDEEILSKYYCDIFEKYCAMGIKKFKLDISYGPKHEMIKLLKLMNKIIKKADSDAEIETHIPDIFASRYADTVRINDVSFDKEGKWRYVTSGHYIVCKNSSPDRILNLDHIGTNAPLADAKNFTEHLELIMEYSKESGGYPTISSLPDIYSKEVSDHFVSSVNKQYDKAGKRKDVL